MRRGRIALGLSAFGVVAAGAAWQWSWLAAIGVAPVLLSIAPCAAMCGLGLCMSRMGGRSCASTRQDGPPVREAIGTSSPTLET